MSKKLSRELIAQKVKSDRIESIRNLNLWGSNIEDISIIHEMPSLEIVSLSVNKNPLITKYIPSASPIPSFEK